MMCRDCVCVRVRMRACVGAGFSSLVQTLHVQMDPVGIWEKGSKDPWIGLYILDQGNSLCCVPNSSEPVSAKARIPHKDLLMRFLVLFISSFPERPAGALTSLF